MGDQKYFEGCVVKDHLRMKSLSGSASFCPGFSLTRKGFQMKPLKNRVSPQPTQAQPTNRDTHVAALLLTQPLRIMESLRFEKTYKIIMSNH